ncbi:hypothetical protein JEQ12_000744 [Ovis aries]|uniref:Uncharacterized protein n=1 Tax=Ovis aries TaxID=9940 RepID=A0A836D794_SHEEP|nr:hypothetical protein JEQ12_000744 [Ovis aries]
MAAQRQLLKEESALGNDSDNCFLGHLGLETSVGGRTRRDNGHEEEMKDLEVCERETINSFPALILQTLFLKSENFSLFSVVYTGENIKVAVFPGVTSVHPASPATLPTNPPEARSSPCLNPPQPLCPPRSTTEGGSVLEPGYLGSSGQWDMMRPQKGSISGDLSSGSSKYQLHSKPTEGLGPAKEALGPCALPPPAQQSRSETCCSELHTSVDQGEVGDEPVASPQDPAALPVNGHRRPGPAAKGRSDRSTATPCRVTLGLEPLCPPRSTTEGGSVLEPGYLGSSGQWDMMRPQKGSISGDLSSGSSKYQLTSKPTGMDMLSIPHTQLETDCYGSRGSSTEKAPSSTSSSLPSEEEKSWIVSTDRDLRRNPSPVA